MKKEYINPELEIIVINAPQLMAGSTPSAEGDYPSGGEVLAPELDWPGLPGSDLPGFGF